MDNTTLFDWLVKYHIQENLTKSMGNYFSPASGVVLGKNGNPQTEGIDKECPHDGLLILKNGNTLIDRLIGDDRVNPESRDVPLAVSNEEQLSAFLRNMKGEDGVYVYESANQQMIRIAHILLKNNISMGKKLPSDFIYYGGDSNPQELGLNLGTKTRLALEITAAYHGQDGSTPINAYQIKRSVTPFGMGKVTHINQQGLAQEFFFLPPYAYPDSQTEIQPIERVKGVYRSYTANGNGLIRVNNNVIGNVYTKDIYSVLGQLRDGVKKQE